MSQRRVLVTGGAGFIGSHLVDRLCREGHQILVYDNASVGRWENLSPWLSQVACVEGDVRDVQALGSAFRDFGPEIVVHLAAIHFIPYCNEHSSEVLDVNVVGTQNVLGCCLESRVQRIMFASSAAIYPIADRALSEADPPQPTDIYGLSKLFGEMLVSHFCSLHLLPGIALRLFNVYGPRETNPHLIPHLVSQAKAGNRVALGNLDSKRDYIYVDDVVDAMLMLMDLALEGRDREIVQLFNVGTGMEHSVTEVVNTLEVITGNEMRVDSLPRLRREVDRKHLLANVSKLSKATGWTPSFDLRKGLTRLLMVESECDKP